MLAGLIADIDLNADLQGRQRFRALLGKPFGDFQTIDRMHPGKRFSHGTRLVALQGADKMPFQPKPRQFRRFADAFLYVIFSEASLARSRSSTNRLGRPGFADSQQRDVIGIAAGLPRR